VGAILICVCFPTALLDIGMNGTRYAGWAPFGLLITFLGLALLLW
jgi:hypothetical protein